jgi:uncharacterized lipoprotein YddW (UPF0748 family)
VAHRRRMVTLVTLTVLLALPFPELCAQPLFAGGKWELRGVWIASVMNYDWPLSPTLTPQRQRDSLVALLDLFASSGFNAIFFQVRPECDALYPSPYEPWSYWLTGAQGTGPSPPYDPLAFAIEETHKRGMELHAWFNPYRAYRQDVSYPRAASHVIEQHPEWTIRCPDGYYLLNPGIPEVRSLVSKVVADVVRRYGIDGVHLDDYFYPYPEHSFTREDSAAWAADPRGFAWDSLAYWRRDNVNLMIHQVYDSVQALKPWLKFGVSPFGIWKSGVPAGISGLSSYNDIFCDPVAWLQGQYVDYVVPQLYWAFGGGQDYAALQTWWASQRNGRHVYTGNADYKITLSGWPASQITDQIRYNQTTGNVQGSVQFRAYNLRTNDGGIANALTADVFRYPSIVPVMGWKETTPPNAPTGLQMLFNSGSGTYDLSWHPPAAASDGDTAARFVLYRFRNAAPVASDLDNPRNILALIGRASTTPPARVDSFDTQYYYAVSALDKNNNESQISNVVTASAPLAPPVLVSPDPGSTTYKKGDPLVWQRSAGALLYRVQLDSTGSFLDGQLLFNALASDTSAVPSGLKAQKSYSWRVIAGSQAAESPVSATRAFTTGWLLPPVPLYPVSKNNINRLTTFQWASNGATSYRIRVVDYVTRATVLDTTTTDTSLTSTTILAASTIFQWYILAANPYGESEWSAESRFRTGTVLAVPAGEEGVPERFGLEQNYPNPFNPSTTIGYSVPGGQASGIHVRLVVYDLLGREASILVNEQQTPGTYAVRFDATVLAAGVYVCRMTAGGFVQARKMVLVK